VVQPVEDGNRDEPSSPRPGWLGHDPPWNPLPNPLVWPCSVEVFDVFLDDPMKLPVPDNQQVIEAFSPQAPQEPFADRVGLGSAVGRLQDFNGACLSDSCEIVAVLAIPVADQEAWGLAMGGDVANRSARGLSPACYGDLTSLEYCGSGP
jgi:hypothetical protein